MKAYCGTALKVQMLQGDLFYSNVLSNPHMCLTPFNTICQSSKLLLQSDWSPLAFPVLAAIVSASSASRSILLLIYEVLYSKHEMTSDPQPMLRQQQNTNQVSAGAVWLAECFGEGSGDELLVMEIRAWDALRDIEDFMSQMEEFGQAASKKKMNF